MCELSFKIHRKETQIFRNEIQARRNKIQIRRNEIQIIIPQFPSPNRALSRTYAGPHGVFSLPITLVLRSVAKGRRVSKDVPERADATSFLTILRHAMLRIAAQDEGSSIAGAFMPDLGSYKPFFSFPALPRRGGCGSLGVARSPRVHRRSFLSSFRVPPVS
jgi:hypothetical protein